MSTDCIETCILPCDDLPEVDFSLCAPQVNHGEVGDVYFTSEHHPLIDETDANEWAYRLALPVGDPSRIIRLMVIGDKPEAEIVEVDGAYNKNYYASKNHIVNIKVYQTSDTNYNMMRVLEKEKKGLGWYKTSSGVLYGGKGTPASIGFNQVIPESSADLEYLNGWLRWKAPMHPCRTLSPI